MTVPVRELDPDVLREKQQLMRSFAIGFNQYLMVYIGLKLGLYRELTRWESTTAEELAGALDFNSRFVLEWLRASAAGGLLEYLGDGRFRAGPEIAELLVNEDSLLSLQWGATNLPERTALVPRALEAFRTGVGHDWDERGPAMISSMEVGFRAWYRQVLVQHALPALDGLVPRLEAGVKVADIGCGAGIALLEMAKAFPRSEFHGYDISANALARATENRDAAGLTNLSFHSPLTEPLAGDHSFTLITTFDVLHDMSEPELAAQAIRGALADDGYWFIADIKGLATFEENLAAASLAPLFYAVSVLGCLQSSMAGPGSVGYGTFGLPEPKMRQLALDAGFTRFRMVDLPSPINAYYEARP